MPSQREQALVLWVTRECSKEHKPHTERSTPAGYVALTSTSHTLKDQNVCCILLLFCPHCNVCCILLLFCPHCNVRAWYRSSPIQYYFLWVKFQCVLIKFIAPRELFNGRCYEVEICAILLPLRCPFRWFHCWPKSFPSDFGRKSWTIVRCFDQILYVPITPHRNTPRS